MEIAMCLSAEVQTFILESKEVYCEQILYKLVGAKF
jgi:hypothetical protein